MNAIVLSPACMLLHDEAIRTARSDGIADLVQPRMRLAMEVKVLPCGGLRQPDHRLLRPVDDGGESGREHPEGDIDPIVGESFGFAGRAHVGGAKAAVRRRVVPFTAKKARTREGFEIGPHLLGSQPLPNTVDAEEPGRDDRMTKVVADTLPPRLVGYTAPQAVEDLVKGPVEEIYRARDRHLSGTPLMVQLPGFGPRRLRYRREELGSPPKVTSTMLSYQLRPNGSQGSRGALSAGA